MGRLFFCEKNPYLWGSSLNPYVYAANSPMMYVDPDGEVAWLIPILMGGIMNLGANIDNVGNFWDGLKYFGIGAAVGAASGVAGTYVSSLTSAMGAIPGAAVGALGGAVTGAATSYVTNGLNNLVGGRSFGASSRNTRLPSGCANCQYFS